MIYFNKIFKIPGPKDLGMSNNNRAMPIEIFAYNNEYTWEKYYARVKKDYPIKYFLASTLPSFFIRKWKKYYSYVDDFIYWIKCHFIKKHKFHWLNLTQPKSITYTTANGISRTINNSDHYKFGWCDVDQRLLFAIFNLLNLYVKDELNVISQEDLLADPSLQQYKTAQDEVLAIHHWWNIDRKLKQEQIDLLTNKWVFFCKQKRKRAADRAHKDFIAAEAALEEETDQMIARLMKIRRSLWT